MKSDVVKLNDLFLDTLSKCGLFLLNEDDNKIEYYLFEEFDIGVISFLHDDNLCILFESGLITSEVLRKSSELRRMVLEIQIKDKWNLESVRSTPEWKRLLELADEIKSLIKKF